MYPGWAKERREEMKRWVEEAKKRLLELDEDDIKFLEDKYSELNRKVSKRLAQVVSEEIANFLGVPEPFLKFKYKWKWDGFFGLAFVKAETWDKVFEK